MVKLVEWGGKCLMEIRGVFSSVNLSELEKDTFVKYLQYSINSPVLEFVRYLLGDDYLKFIDILSGTTFKIPSSKSLERDLEYVRIYTYIKKRGFTESSIRSASKSFGKTVSTIKKSVYKVSKVLGIEDTLEGEQLDNYIKLIGCIDGCKKHKGFEQGVN